MENAQNSYLSRKLIGLITAVIVFVGQASSVALAQTPNPNSAVEDSAGAIHFIQTLSKETAEIFSDATLSGDAREQAFTRVFEQATDLELLSKAILGRHYRTASTEQRKNYMEAMKTFLISELDKNMDQIGFKELVITGTTPASGKRGHVFVRTQVDRDEGQPLLADWRVRKRGGIFQIVNLEIEGINLLITNRELFSSRIRDIGLDGLIKELRTSASGQ